jgi:hypothetical protein
VCVTVYTVTTNTYCVASLQVEWAAIAVAVNRVWAKRKEKKRQRRANWERTLHVVSRDSIYIYIYISFLFFSFPSLIPHVFFSVLHLGLKVTWIHDSCACSLVRLLAVFLLANSSPAVHAPSFLLFGTISIWLGGRCVGHSILINKQHSIIWSKN